MPSNALIISSGKDASKFSGTVNSPAHNPNGRNASGGTTTGLISAIGFPVRIMSNVSPASTRSRKKESRFHRWVNPHIACKLVAHAKDTKAALALEDLTGIRDRMTVRKGQRNKHSGWSFRQLRAFIVYKAQRAGVPVVFVDPRNSSRTCRRCGFVEKRNRRSQAEFSCLRCGHTCHADLNGASILAQRAAVSRPDLVAPRNGQLAFAW